MNYKDYKLVVLFNGGYWIDEHGKSHMKNGFIRQFEELQKYFGDVEVHAFLDKTYADGYEANIKIKNYPFTKQQKRLPLIRQIRYVTSETKKILDSLDNKTVVMNFFPGSYYGIIFAAVLKRTKAKYINRITNDLSLDFVNNARGFYWIFRKIFYVPVKLVVDFYINYLLRGSVNVYTGSQIYKRNGKDLVIYSSSIREENIQSNVKVAQEGGPMRILFVGFFLKSKGLKYLIKALVYLKKNNFDFILDIVGEGYREGYAKKKVERLGLGDLVHFLGYVPFGEDIFRIYRNHDVLIMPSLQESQGKVYLEAMAVGTPVIATDLPVIQKIIRDGYNGIVVKRKSSKAISDAIMRIRDKEFSSMLSANALSEIKNFTVENQTKVLINFLQSQL